MPCGLLRDADIISQFVGTDAVLAVGNEPDAHHPLVHAERGILEDGSDLNSELLFATLAKPHVAGGNVGVLIVAAARACDDAIRPPEPHGPSVGAFGIGEIGNGFL